MGGRALTWFLIRLVKVSLLVVVPLMLISVLVLRSINSDLNDIALERASLRDLDLREGALQAVISYREAFLRQREPLRVASARVSNSIHAVDVNGQHKSDDTMSAAAWARVHNFWNGLHAHPSIERIDQLVQFTGEALVAASDDTDIANDRSRTVRALTGVMVNEGPQLLIDVHRVSDTLSIVLSQREMTFSDRVHIAAMLTVMQTMEQNIKDNLAISGRKDSGLSTPLQHIINRLDQSVKPFIDGVEPIVENLQGNRAAQLRWLSGAEANGVFGAQELIASSHSEISAAMDRVDQRTHMTMVFAEILLTLLWGGAIVVIVRLAENTKQRAREIAEYESTEQARRGEELRRRNAEIALATKTQTFRAVFERAPVGIAMVDTKGDITEWNPELQRFLANRRINLIDAEHSQAFQDLIAQRMPLLDFERSFIGPNGVELWASLIVSRVYDDGSHMALCMVQDITEDRLSTERLEHEATHDGLTGLANRRLFRASLADVINSSLASGDIFAVLFIDLDLFKYVNDTFGHAAGDFVLLTVAERLRRLVTAEDTVARFGGDEFAILVVPPCPADSGEQLANSITTSLAEPIFWEGQQVNIGSSIGLIYGPGPYEHADDIMRNADTAMYAAKSSGRGRYVAFDPLMQEAAHQRAQLSNDLQSALSDPEQIHVLYQPIVSLQDNAIMGFEALARWRHPIFGDIGPEEFVKIAEQSGAIRQLGRSVMSKAFTQLAAAGQKLPDLSRLWLSVNLSPTELSAPDFVESVAAAIRETDFDPSRLYLEITESQVIESGEQANRILSRLREFGIRVSIDDFGAGYSSLRYLQELDLDLIKIDQGFLKRTDKPESRKAILRAIVGLATAFGLPVCAEGVETNEQLKLVRGLGFQYAQGRIWGPPMSIQEIEARFFVGGTYAERDHTSK